MERRRVRYQAAIMREDAILLLRAIDHIGDGKEFWLLPGGGILPGETDEACVRREVREETALEVAVERLLFEAPAPAGDVYSFGRTYLCRPLAGEAAPGWEPEVDTPERRTIQAVDWFDLRDPAGWPALIREDAITFPLLQAVRAALGYARDA
jgi:8-oxo-dGTP diphosphatase